MFWPTDPHPISLEELGWVNTAYLASTKSRGDPTIVWGTTITTEALNNFVSQQRSESGVMVSTAHVLIRAVVEALYRHPKLNRRVIGRRVYPYNGIHITMPMLEMRTGEVKVIYLSQADRMSLAEISRTVWEKARDAAVRASVEQRENQASSGGRRPKRWRQWIWLRWTHLMASIGFFIANRVRPQSLILREMFCGGTFVNHLGFPGAPPMIAFKPSCLPTNSFGVSVTLGPAEQKPAVENGQVVVKSIAPLYVRVDHRMVNGYQTAEFIKTLRALLHDPTGLVESAVDANRKPD